jgi:uncharacterized membrane protein YuzA (DUF378 family)
MIRKTAKEFIILLKNIKNKNQLPFKMQLIFLNFFFIVLLKVKNMLLLTCFNSLKGFLMMTAFLLAQIFTGISCAFYALSLLLKSKSKLLIVQIISSIFFVTQYFLLGSYIGGAIATLEMIRVVVFYFINKYKDTNKVRFIASISFIVVGLVCAIFTWANWYSIFPLLGLITVTVCLGLKNLIALKISCIFSALCATFYLYLLGSIFGMFTQIFIIIVGITGLIIYIVKNKNTIKEEKNEESI